MAHYDFSGWATRNDILCSDGRTIRRNAFIGNDGETVPLVWNHNHKEPSNILGHALLENRDEGVYCYGSFNNTAEGQRAKALVKHGDITKLSIFANGLRQTPDKYVTHGNIREVSLVLAGANIGAYIETLDIQHADDPDYDEEYDAVIFTDLKFELAHADDD
jgi:HK97 family phage prohead protease